MQHQHLILATTAAALGLLSACASGIPRHESDQQVRDRYNAYAGEPLDHFNWLGRYDGWEPIGRYELVLLTGVTDAYLLKVGPPCDNLQFATRIGVSSTTGAVYTRFDSVTTGRWRCPIQEIRKVDYRRMRADMRLDAQKAKATVVPGGAPAPQR
jgi:hypothetical protein